MVPNFSCSDLPKLSERPQDTCGGCQKIMYTIVYPIPMDIHGWLSPFPVEIAVMGIYMDILIWLDKAMPGRPKIHNSQVQKLEILRQIRYVWTTSNHGTFIILLHDAALFIDNKNTNVFLSNRDKILHVLYCINFGDPSLSNHQRVMLKLPNCRNIRTEEWDDCSEGHFGNHLAKPHGSNCAFETRGRPFQFRRGFEAQFASPETRVQPWSFPLNAPKKLWNMFSYYPPVN